MASSKPLTPAEFEAEVINFARKLDQTLTACLPRSPGTAIVVHGNSYVVKCAGQNPKAGGVPLLVNGEHLAWLRFDYKCRLDYASSYLAVDTSSISIVAVVDSTPIFRFDYLSQPDRVPGSHINVHAQRGALSHLLSKSGHPKPHDLASLHLPTGGSRFRPELEDVIQFLIVDCRFDSLDGWQEHVHAGRALYRELQVKSVVRSMPEPAAEQLVALGYTVTPPVDGHPPSSTNAKHRW